MNTCWVLKFRVTPYRYITNSTCNKDGKRPALLARLHELVRVAKRVIIASADVTDAEIDYVQTLRGIPTPLHLT